MPPKCRAGCPVAVRLGLVACVVALSSAVFAAEAWRDEFDRICGQTVEATSLSAERLRALVHDSDVLLKRLDLVSDPAKKVYVLRLQKCRDLFVYLLELKAARGAAAPHAAVTPSP
jgi:hypothetical protein